MAQFDLKRATVKIVDGDDNELEVKIGEGTVTYDEKRTIEYQRDRGLLDTCREGDEEPMDVKMDFTWEYVKGNGSGSGSPSIEDALKKINGATAWVSSDTTDPCAPFAVSIVIEYTPLCSGSSTAGQNETITLPHFRYESISHDAKAGTCSITGKCNATKATAVRS